MSTVTIEALVHTLRYEARGIISVELRPAAPEARFPAFQAGSHIDLHLGNGLVRSYSLTNPGAPGDTQTDRYVVAVLNDRASRGGSRWVHEQLRVGSTIRISPPRNHFHLHEDAPHTVLVAGGIGVTPIYGMLRRLTAIGRQPDFIYCARSRAEAAFAQEIEALAGPRLRWHLDDAQGGPPDLRALLSGLPPHTHLYCCGPGPMLDAFVAVCQALGYPNAHIERFTAVKPVEDTTTQRTDGYTVELRKTGRTITVGPTQSILDALLDAGMNPEYSCQDGICGSCETRVLSGEVDHRDSILTDAERAASKTMMICVSRCKSDTLVLDL